MSRAFEWNEETRKKAAAPEAWDAGEFAELLDSVVAEAKDNLDILSKRLLDLERNPEDREPIDPLFRAAHNLKGLSRVVSIDKMNWVAASMENVLEEFRQGTRRVTEDVVDLLLAGVDSLRDQVLPCLAGKRPVEADVTPLIERFVALAQGGAAPAPPKTEPAPAPVKPASVKPAPPTPAKPPPAAMPPAARAPASTDTASLRRVAEAPKGSDPTLRVTLEKLDSVVNLVGELVIGRIRLDQRVVNLSSLGDELARARRALRALRADRTDAETLRDFRERIERSLWRARTLPTEEERWAAAHEGIAESLLALRKTLEAHGPAVLLEGVADEVGRIERVHDDLMRELTESTDQLGLLTSELQQQVMKVRMVPVAHVFQKFPRMVRDLTRQLGKSARLEVSGEETELDKMLVEAVSEPLMHLVRNAIDHGIEPPAERARASKPVEGVIRISAYHRGSMMYIEVEDDGRGIDPRAVKEAAVEKGLVSREEAAAMDEARAIDLIFRAGLTTAKAVSDLSGRGVGLDVVREGIARLNGSVVVESRVGTGTRFRVGLPLTLAIINVLLVSKGRESFAIPLAAVLEMLSARKEEIRHVGNREILDLRGSPLFLVRLDNVLGLPEDTWLEGEGLPVVVIGTERRRIGLVVDRLVGKHEVVIKNLGTILLQVPFVLGSTILGDGRVILILDPQELIEAAGREPEAPRPVEGPAVEAPSEPEAPGVRPLSLLLVDDSPTIRSRLRDVFRAEGYRVVEAEDGAQALEVAKRETFDLVTTDIMMPRMDGYEFCRGLRKLPQYKSVPVVMITSKGEKLDKIRGFDAGADDYVTKPFDREAVLTVIREHLRRVEARR